MKLSNSQVQRFWREWSAVCRYQRWQGRLSAVEIDAHRKQLLARCGFESLKDVDRTSGFDRVLAELRSLQDDVDATVEVDDPTIGEARRLRNVIRQQILPCLALYEEDPDGYLQTVVSGLVRWGKTDRPERAVSLDDLDARPIITRRGGVPHESPSQLHQVLMTLSGRLDTKRRLAGHTLHHMKRLAGVQCAESCMECAAEQTARIAEAEPVPEEVPF